MIKVPVEARILSAESKPYSFEGKSGTTHRIRLLAEGEIFECKSTPEQVNELSHEVDNEGSAVLSLTSPKERVQVKLISFEGN